MNLVSISSLEDEKIINILKNEFSKLEKESYLKNYHPDYSNSPENLFYLLKNNKFKNSSYYILLNEQEEYVCSSGWYQYDFNTALLMVRTFVSKNYRSKHYVGKHILPLMIEESEGFLKRWITVNSYNLSLYKWWLRADQNKPGCLVNDWPEIYKKFKPIGIKEINYTMQYVVEYKV